MATSGYYRYPSVFKDQLVFVSEDDLWQAPLSGGNAHRLTSGLGACTHPVFSPNGEFIAFSGTDEGHREVYIMPSQGGEIKRITYLGDVAHVVGWTAKGIIFASSAGFPFARVNHLFYANPQTSQVIPLNMGPATFMSCAPEHEHEHDKCVIQRHGYREYGYWKRYRGGTAGEVWIDSQGTGQFNKLVDLQGNLARPLWIKDRIYFASDHEGVGNLYSCDTQGQDVHLHSKHEVYYVRNLSTDGEHIIYHAGADLYKYNVLQGQSSKIEIEYASARHHRNRKFVRPDRYLEDYNLHPNGHTICLTTRGKAYFMGNWDGPTLQISSSEQARYRLATWLNDGQRLLVVSDEGGEETLEIYDCSTLKRQNRLSNTDLGRIVEMQVSPVADEVVLSNHRSELIHINLKTWKYKILDQSGHGHISGFDWSPDGQWIAYSFAQTHHTSVIKIVAPKPAKSKPQVVSKPILFDVEPHFDPEGKYLYFISYRTFNPVRDNLHFELSFPKGGRPYLITLRKDLTDPFSPLAPELDNKVNDKEDKAPQKDDKQKKENVPEPVVIDFDGIQNRMVAFPVCEAKYTQIQAIKGKVLYGREPVQGTCDDHDDEQEETSTSLYVYDFEEQKETHLLSHINEFELSRQRNWMIYRTGGRELRVLKAGDKPDSDTHGEKYSKAQGWLDLSRVKVLIHPTAEWQQMLHEAWRLQRDNFWTEDMSKVDWQAVYDHYAPLLGRVNTREEFNDLLWEMQGELGTSHAYVMGGDISTSPHHYGVGALGADFELDIKTGVYRFINLKNGDSWDPHFASPLQQLGINIKQGDLLWAIGGRELSANQRPEPILLNLAHQEVRLSVSDSGGKNKRTVTIKALSSSTGLSYRHWVEQNRRYVHEKTKGQVGYIHIPDMSPWGYAEFHRGFLAECDREGLVVDVRFNGGGNVSPLLLEKLARRRRGYDISRWFGAEPSPADSPSGPMVALTNEYAGSDGDMFSHCFKLMELGPLIGKRTWGGVIGIWPRYLLADRGGTTQPEFSFWFSDVGWSIENYGAEPDIEVEITPQDHAQGLDPQLDRGIKEVLQIIKQSPPLKPPTFGNRPNLRQPYIRTN